MYYLHRAGETTGPYVTAHLVRMVEEGEIGADALVCEVGTEEWVPVEVVLPVVDVVPRAPEPVYGLKTSGRPWAFLPFILFPIVALGFSVWGQGIGWQERMFVGLLVFILCTAINRPKWLCGQCGNRIEKTSGLCPVCKATLVFQLPKPISSKLVRRLEIYLEFISTLRATKGVSLKVDDLDELYGVGWRKDRGRVISIDQDLKAALNDSRFLSPGLFTLDAEKKGKTNRMKERLLGKPRPRLQRRRRS